MIKVKRALISVSDKKGLIPFVKGLNSLGVEILSTGGTAKLIRAEGILVRDVADYTGFPEMLDGRVKTLHPKIHGALLALRENEDHMAQVKKQHIELIDMVVVNLYPFASVTQKKNVSLETALENIDIGGPSMLRSSAKNYKSVAVICNPERYQNILEELNTNSGILSDTVLYRLAVEAFEHTARYDKLIHEYLSQRMKGESFVRLPQHLEYRFSKVMDLRYGENPHQNAAFYADGNDHDGLTKIKQLNGKELSFNNILDINAALQFIKDFDTPCAVIIKHNNPTGIATDKTLAKAYQACQQSDPVSAFGGIIGLNQKVDLRTAQAIQKSGFMECIVAPGYENSALKLLSGKKNLRITQIDLKGLSMDTFDIKKVFGGALIQEPDKERITAKDLKTVTKRKVTSQQIQSLLFGWSVIKYVKSNAILLVKGKRTVGIGCGQTSRVESIRTAIAKAGKEAKGSLLVSDAFLPHVDNIMLAARAGVKAIIHTGGSVADAEVIKVADKAGIAMVTTGIRHFKH